MTLTEIRGVLASRGMRPLKQFGQNFLHDQNLARWLAERALQDIGPDALVLEIGPGLGALTEGLLRLNARLIAMEKDRGMCAFLREKFAGEIACGRLELVEGDALALIPQLKTTPAVICGNLPYYISTPLLMECLHLPGEPGRLFFVVQKEVGQRLAAGPGTKAYGALSILVQVGYEVENMRTLPGSVFFPPPEVASLAVELRPRARPLIGPSDRESFSTLVQRGFSQRRKKLSNLLATDDGRRAEELAPEDWVELWRRLRDQPPAA